MDEIITMDDMAAVYELTDAMGIDREAINVELAKEDPGSWGKGDGGMIKREVFAITLPLTQPLDAWLPTLKEGLERLLATPPA